jgi:hypothetical protein
VATDMLCLINDSSRSSSYTRFRTNNIGTGLDDSSFNFICIGSK